MSQIIFFLMAHNTARAQMQIYNPLSQHVDTVLLYIIGVLVLVAVGIIFLFHRTRVANKIEQRLVKLIEERTRSLREEKERTERALLLTEISRQELAASEERYRNLVENINEVFQVIDPDGNITYVSPNVESEYGYQRSELIGKKYYQFITPNDRRRVLHYIEERKRDGSAKLSIHFRTLLKNGTTKWIELSGRIVRGNNGEATEYHNVIRDIHDRKQTEEQLSQSEERLRIVFENMPIIVTALDARNYVLLWNKAAERVTGYTAEEVIGNYRVMELFVPNIEQRRIIYKKLLRFNGSYSNWEIDCTCKDGTIKTIAFSSVAKQYPIPAYPGGWGIGVDVTERKKLEQNLIQSQKMESIGTLAGGIAHDFNNILAIIIGYSKLLRNEVNDTEKVLLRGAAITQSAERGAGLVRQLLTFARKTDVVFESVHINTLVEEMMIVLQETFPKNISLHTNIEPLMPSIKASGMQLHQVLLNLCLNARDAMPEGGALTITTCSVTSSQIKVSTTTTSASDMYVCLRVNDTGVGMDETTKQRMYEPFYTTKERGRGTGLGLSVAYGIVQSHNGFIEVESAKGQGTTFSLYFPVHREVHITPTPAIRAQPMRTRINGTETILVVDDEPMLRELLKGLLEEQGYTVLQASDGASGVAMFRAHVEHVSLVITDLDLPKVSGREMLQQMKVLQPNIKVIFLSGYLEERLREETVAIGANDCIPKPFSPDFLLNRVREIIDGR